MKTRFISFKKLPSANWKSYAPYLFILSLLLVSHYGYAQDLGLNTETDMVDTWKGSGKHWAFLIDGIASLGLFMITKKYLCLFSGLAVAVFIPVVAKFAGG